MLKKTLILFVLPSWLWAASVQPLDKVVAIVNDDVVTESELNAQVNALKRQLQAKHVEVPADKVLKKQILQHLIDVDLQLQIAKRNDVLVDDKDIDSAIENIAKSNNISFADLKAAVAEQGLTWATYRQNVRKEMLISKLQQQAVGKEITITNEQIEDYLKSSTYEKKRQSTYHVMNIVIPLSDHPTSKEVAQAKAKAVSLLNKIKAGADFSTLAVMESSGTFALEGGDLGERNLAELPEVFANRVVDMQVGEVAGPIRTGNGYQLIKLAAVGGDNSNHIVTKTHVRHILVKADSSMTAVDAEKQINNIYQQIKAGKDFAAMAKLYSVDAASAVNGGDLGWVDSEELVPEFSAAMEKLKPHQISRPVKSPFGWHLIEVMERKSVDDSKAFERQQVRRFLTQRKFSEAAQNWVQHLRSDAYIKILDKDLA